MAKKNGYQSIPNIHGWMLVTREESDHETGAKRGPWYVAWHALFSTQKEALAFAKENGWQRPYEAIRAKTVALKKMPV